MAKQRADETETSGSTRRLGFWGSSGTAWLRDGPVSVPLRGFLLLCLSVVFLAAGCGGDTDTGSTDPASDGDPWGLDAIELPAESDAIAASNDPTRPTSITMANRATAATRPPITEPLNSLDLRDRLLTICFKSPICSGTISDVWWGGSAASRCPRSMRSTHLREGRIHVPHGG